jgi:hypothetical protein
MTPSQRRIFLLISSGQATKFMASYAHGKQKRTKTRKEKTEEAKNLVAGTLSNSPRASSLKFADEARHESPPVVSHSASVQTNWAAPPFAPAKGGAFDYDPADSPFPTGRGATPFFSPDRTPRTVNGELFTQDVPLPPVESWNLPGNTSFSPDNSAATYNHQRCYKTQPLSLIPQLSALAENG